MAYQFLTTRADGPVEHLTLNRPDVRNAFNEQVIAELTAARVWDAPIVTEVAPLAEFYPAEDYHQDYFEKNPFQPYCRAVVAPKVAKFRKHFLEKLKA